MAADIDSFMNNALRPKTPSLKWGEVGDAFAGTIVGRNVVDGKTPDGEPKTSLVVEIELDAPRTQTVNQRDETTGYLVPKQITSSRWSWWLSEGSRALTSLSEATKKASAGPGAPHPGDRVSVKFIGLQASTKVPAGLRVLDIQYVLGDGKPAIDEDNEPF